MPKPSSKAAAKTASASYPKTTAKAKGPAAKKPRPARSDPPGAPLLYCRQPVTDMRQFGADVATPRAFSIISFGKQWVKGTTLTYHCYAGSDAGVPGAWRGSPIDIAEVRKAFDEWAALGIGIEFREVANPQDATVRIGFDQSDGSWSYVGRDVLSVRDPQHRTMNFGWPLTTTHGHDTALHEIGHTLGLEHEHQNPHAGIVWNVPAVRNHFRAAPNSWDDATIEQNILRKIATDSIKGSQWDPDSVMEYAFAPGLIAEPARYTTTGLHPAGGLSQLDIAWVRVAYPKDPATAGLPQLKTGLSQLLQLDRGQTRVFEFVAPRTRTYNVGTFGTSDTVVVLFEVTPQGNVQLAGDDDSGVDRNALIQMRLTKGRTYQIGIRLYYADAQAETAIMVW
ncbi:M12 family metallopeptidase [Hydrogenophaga sp. A37]|uniref:M12 family metallopeptidase n=1 Tax=Hydrogenophaga sp. A37 TaxID=1945864 RepID=UPI000987BFFB|nr:M12 family metallopeptidase [Hydrogenophaga sp. A37]